jgi:hypothetical protein
MKVFLGTVLSLIAAGVLLTAYGLLAPRATAAAPMTMTYEPLDGSQLARPIYASERVPLSGGPGAYGYGGRESIDRPGRRAIYQGNPVNRARSMRTDTPPATRVAVDRGRDWKRTAMVIGGSTAAGAGLGAIFGGKKGALIGAALGGGASTIYEVRRR